MGEDGVTRRQVLQAGLGMLAGAAVPGLPGLPALVEAGATTPAAEKTQQPNIVYILSDELRPCSLGYQSSEVSTPHIDAFAPQGAQFAHAVSTSPICTPHRACLMTGRYPTVTGVTAD
jgi:hypothetical protein